jgi:hypothetical protein
MPAQTPKLKPERIAQIVAEADLFGVAKTVERWGITDRTIRNYRARINDEPELADIFRSKKKELSVAWLETSSQSMLHAIAHAGKLMEKVETLSAEKAPGALHAVTGYIKIVGELQIAAHALSMGAASNTQALSEDGLIESE